MIVALLLVLVPTTIDAEKTTIKSEKVEKVYEYIQNKTKPMVFPKGDPIPKEEPKKPVQDVVTPHTASEKEALEWIISREGGPTSVNRYSLACGLAQSLPCSKILTYAGVDLSKYNLNTYDGVKAAISTVPVETQRAWMIQYCVKRYGSVVNAMYAWQRQGWY